MTIYFIGGPYNGQVGEFDDDELPERIEVHSDDFATHIYKPIPEMPGTYTCTE